MLAVHSLADMAIAPPVPGVEDQSPNAGMEPVRSIVSPNVVSSRTVKVIGALESLQAPAVEVEVGFVVEVAVLEVVVGLAVVVAPI